MSKAPSTKAASASVGTAQTSATSSAKAAPHAARPGRPPRVAMETTLLLHGVPRKDAPALADALEAVVREGGAIPCLSGVVHGVATSELSAAQLRTLLDAPPASVPKLNSSTLGLAIHRKGHGATTVSATMELAAAAGIRVFATGGLGGVHRGMAEHLDISADLGALARFPVAVVASGCKSILDVPATRELLETLGVPVIGWQTDRFPAFYQRDGGVGLDGRFDDITELASYIRGEISRTGRGIVVCNAIPADAELKGSDWERWLEEAQAEIVRSGVSGRDITPMLLAAVHRLSEGATLRANIALIKSNVQLATKLAVAMSSMRGTPSPRATATTTTTAPSGAAR
ncbi:MAG: pseudouridine-5'-phosphate glycosidase [Phycisphaerales bacterium]|jgi:pseudouridine-5'-phosphate glycosidase|nr:pseudouridine-5'-phosphate glycosidase [Phycisphaeraceae bacterium]